MINQLSALYYLLRQDISIRNDHAGTSNLTVMLQHVLSELPWVDNHKFQSLEIINEMIHLMGHIVPHSLIADLLSKTWFSLPADETKDISNPKHRYQKSIMLIKFSLIYSICCYYS